MATAVIMPRQGQSVESCIITEWHKQVGDTVQEGDPLFTYETDKATFEEPAKASGTLLARFFEVDDDVPVLVNVAVIGTPGEDISSLTGDATPAASSETAPVQEAKPVSEAAPVAPAAAAAPAVDAAVSPRAKAAADRLNVAPEYALPSGPHGRIIERDVVALAASGARATAAALKDGAPATGGTGIGGRFATTDIATVEHGAVAARPASSVAPVVTAGAVAEYEDVKLPNIRKSIAKAMHASLATMAQLTHSSSFDASAILALRKQLKAAPEQLEVPNITLNDIVLYAVSRVLPRHRDMNAHFLDDKMRYFNHVHLGFAVDTPRGLLVPTIFNADLKSLREISEEAKALAKAAQEGSISPDYLTGASFTISNLGAMGIEQFTPIVNPPQTGILGVCTITERIRTVDGAIKAYPAMGLSLTYDHRAVDGAPASRFLQELCKALENFTTLLIG